MDWSPHVSEERENGKTGIADLDHDGELPELADKLLRLVVVDLVLHHSRELAAV